MNCTTIDIEGKRVRKRKRRRPINFGAISFVFAHMIIPVLMVVVFYFYCNFQSFFMAFQRIENEKIVWSTYNFEWIFEQFGEGGIMKEALLNTLMWWGIQMFLVVFGVFTSYFIYKKITGAKVFRIVFLIPGLISAVVMTYIIQRMLGTSGFIAQWVMKIDGLSKPPDLLRDPQYAKTWLIIKSFPFAIATNMLIWVGSMSRVPDSVLESAKLDGAGWFTEMFRIVLPMIMTAVGVTLCSNISGIFNANGGEFLYTMGDYGTMTLNTWMYLQIYNTSGMSNSYYQASAVGWVMTIVLIPIILVTRHFMNKLGEVEY